MSTKDSISSFSTRENLYRSKMTIENAGPKLAYMKMMKEQVKNTPSLSVDDAKYETLNFFDSKIQELEAAVVEEKRQKMMADARSKLTSIKSAEEINNLLIDARGQPRYSCILYYSYGAGKTPLKDYKFFNSTREVSEYISQLVKSYPGVYPKDSYILPTSIFLDQMFGIANTSSLNINKEKDGVIPCFEFTSKRINY